MPYSNGNTEPSAPFIKTKELDWLQFSGVFKALICGAFYGEDVTKDGKPFKTCDLDLAVEVDNKNLHARVRFFLPSNEMADLCYFFNMRNSAGQLEFPDYKEHDSKDGKYHFKDFPQIVGLSIYAGITFIGMSPKMNGTYNLVAFCNAQGQTAYEHFKQLPASRLAELKAITKANSAKQPASQPKQTFGGQQYQPQPQQTYQAPQPQTMTPQPQVQPQTAPQVQPVAPQYQPQAQTMAAQAPQMAPVQLQGQTMMPTGRQFPDDIPF